MAVLTAIPEHGSHYYIPGGIHPCGLREITTHKLRDLEYFRSRTHKLCVLYSGMAGCWWFKWFCLARRTVLSDCQWTGRPQTVYRLQKRAPYISTDGDYRVEKTLHAIVLQIGLLLRFPTVYYSRTILIGS